MNFRKAAKINNQNLNMFIRFLMSGGVNTAVTYLLYLVLILFFPYKLSYTISFVAGIFIAYCLSRFFVFRVRTSVATMTVFPIIYLIQYFLGLGVVILWGDVLQWNIVFAPLASIALTIPVTFLLSRLLFLKMDV